MEMEKVILQTNLPGVSVFKKGKVRDLYDFGDKILIICTDRISAFDCVLLEGIPLKGAVLNQLSRFWFEKTKDLVPNHMISTDLKDLPSLPSSFEDTFKGRVMLVKKTEPIKIECVVRGYLAGSAFKEYKKTGCVAGYSLPSGLRESDPLPSPIFTPATKSTKGHDINISFKEMETLIGKKIAENLRKISLKIYEFAANFLDSRGFILADTKMEFGILDGKIVLIDELITPDSSRFWLKETYTPGKHQESFDKQYVRDYLEKIGWDKNPPPPSLPPEVIRKTSQIYQEVYKRITGEDIKSVLKS